MGEVDTVGGEYANLLNGPSGNGTLAFILFQFLTGQENNNPNFSVQSVAVVQGAPEPATFVLLASSLVMLGGRRLLRREPRH